MSGTGPEAPAVRWMAKKEPPFWQRGNVPFEGLHGCSLLYLLCAFRWSKKQATRKGTEPSVANLVATKERRMKFSPREPRGCRPTNVVLDQRKRVTACSPLVSRFRRPPRAPLPGDQRHGSIGRSAQGLGRQGADAVRTELGLRHTRQFTARLLTAGFRISHPRSQRDVALSRRALPNPGYGLPSRLLRSSAIRRYPV
jgi:hypothetical protein